MQLARKQISRRSENPNWTYWDVTAKSALPKHKCMAPPWGLVMGLKNRQITWEEYKRVYLGQLEDNKQEIIKFIQDEMASDTSVLVFMCYCPDNDPCHTYLLESFVLQHVPGTSLFQTSGNI